MPGDRLYIETSVWNFLLVDDAPENIDDMKKVNPEIKSIRIERIPLSDQDFVGVTREADLVVPSLSELSPLLFS